MPTKNNASRFDCLEGNFDMTNIPRLPTNTEDPVLNKFNASCNEHSERVEDLWIELDFQMWEQMELASKKLKARRAAQRDRDNLNHVKQLHKQGFTLEEIAGITRLNHKEVYNMVHDSLKSNDIFDECPEEILADISETYGLE